MKYMGSKSRIARHILPVILEGRKEGQYYAEPFCGGCNSLDKVPGNRIAGDINKYLIAMWKGLQDGSRRPHRIPKAVYDKARADYNNRSNNYFSDFEIGWIGWAASFNGRFFDGGYSGRHKGRDYVDEQVRNIEKQLPAIAGVMFYPCDYSLLPVPPRSIIYCDIPYKGTKQYSMSGNFDHKRFWDWCFRQKDAGHTVFVSEYSAPQDVQCVWEMAVTNSLNTAITYKPVEKLFRI